MKIYISIFFRKRKLLLSFITIFSIISCAEIDVISANKEQSVFKNNLNNYKLYQYDEESLILPPLVQFIVNYENPISVQYSNNFKKTCNYTKIPFSLINVKNWNAQQVISPTTRVIIIVDTKVVNDETISSLVQFVAQGGTLLIPYYCEDKRFGFLIGLKENAEYSFNILSKGFHLNSDFLPEFKNKSFRDEDEHYALSRENFSNSITVLSSASNDTNYPVIVENKIGNGKVINFNSAYLLNKMDRGLLFSALIRGLEGVPYPIVNSNTIFLDDFPSPLYDTKVEPIKTELNLSIAEFVEQVWWPDMKKLAKKHEISYTAIPAFDYNNKITPPFLFIQWDSKKTNRENTIMPISSWLMKDCLYNGHELGFHGYNHVSLMKRYWETTGFIETALEGVQKKWMVSNFQSLPVSYVPPSNEIDKTGIEHLKKGMPSILFNCSLYLGQLSEGCNREFDFDPYHHQLFDYPRISSGYYLDNNGEYTVNNIYLYTGIWNHFVHPDDVYQIKTAFNKTAGNYEVRNSRGLGWRTSKDGKNSIYHEFDNLLSNFRSKYPKSRFLNAKDGATLTLDWRATKYMHKQKDDLYSVAALNTIKAKNNYWFVYVSQENLKKMELQIASVSLFHTKTKYHDGYLFMVCTKLPKIEIENLNPISSNVNTDLVLQNFNSFLKKSKNFHLGIEPEEKYTENNIDLIRLLKQKIIATPKIDTIVWNEYAKLLSWEDRGNEVWQLLEEHCIKNPLSSNILYATDLAEIIGYPNEIAHQKWLEAQLLIKPKDTDLLNNYVANFYSDENQENIKQALKTLLSVDTSSDTSLKNYIQHLIWYDSEEAIKELDNIKPNSTFSDLATNIVWLYANVDRVEEAYEWSFYSKEIDIKAKLEWLYQLEKYNVLEEEYKTYIAKYQDDFKTKFLMSSLYQSMGKFKEAWILADELPESIEKAGLRKQLNEAVIYESDLLQDFLLENYPDLFYDNIKTKQQISSRLKNGNFIQTENELQSNQKISAALKTVHSYNFYDDKKNTHKIAGTYSEFYPIPFINDISNIQGSNLTETEIQALISEINIPRNLYGIEYKFNNPIALEKINYWYRTRIEKDNFEKYYFQFGVGTSFLKNTRYSSAQINFQPVETAPGHNKNIYQAKSNLYQNQYLLKYFNTSLALEGNYYTRSNRNNVFQLKDSYDVTGVFRFSYLKQNDVKVKLAPYFETSYTMGSMNLTDGFPYWTLKERFYYGGGLSWNYGLETDVFYTKIDGSYFKDDFAQNFQRYSGTLNYRFLNYTNFITQFEFFVQNKFYSNTIQIGLKHIFKEKSKFTPK